MENKPTNSRRKFLTDTAKGAALVVLSTSAAGTLLASCAGPKGLAAGAGLPKNPKDFFTGLDQSPLPYAYNALENHIDAKTMEIHYSKHAAAYSKALKEAVAAEDPSSAGRSDVIVNSYLPHISKYSVKMRNNAGGHYNHEMFWKSMRPAVADNKPSGELAAAIDNTFGSFANFKMQFTDAGKNRFGSGWAWLYRDSSNVLKIGSTPNQDNPLMDVSEIKGFPILGLDVWEHAYYLKYQNKRPDYIEHWWNVLNWEYIERRFNA